MTMDATRMHRRTLLGLAGGAALGALVPERLARAAPLSDRDFKRLRFANTEVRIPLDLDLPQGFYFGGIVYRVCISLGSTDLLMNHVAARFPNFLMCTGETRLLMQSGRDMQVYLGHDAAIGPVSLVLLVRRQSPSLLRFWVDLSQPHALDDGWGFLRIEPFPRELVIPPVEKLIGGNPIAVSLLTWGVLMRIDSDEVRLRFLEIIRNGAMEPVERIAIRPPYCHPIRGW